MRRTKSVIKAARLTMQNQAMYGNNIPKRFCYLQGVNVLNIPIKNPIYKGKKDFLAEDNNKVFIELYERDIKAFFSFGDAIFLSKSDSQFPFYNNELDISNPGISAFRVYSNSLDYIQVQVRKIPNYKGIFQLDYFECDNSVNTELKSIILCDISDYNQSTLDIVYGPKGNAYMEYAKRIVTTFRFMQYYIRPWDYSVANKSCVFAPFNCGAYTYWKKE